MSELTRFTYRSPVGVLVCTLSDEALIGISFGEGYGIASADMTDGLCAMLVGQLDEYFARKRREFTVPYRLCGSPFRMAVWNEIAKIPYGQTRSYGEIAYSAGSVGACRAVGTACRLNPIPLVIPCHRVTAARDIGGYAYGLEIKRQLFELEGISEVGRI